MNKEDEDQYLAFCSDAMFRIHIFKLRLSRYELTAPPLLELQYQTCHINSQQSLSGIDTVNANYATIL